jgi:hypothetical protein
VRRAHRRRFTERRDVRVAAVREIARLSVYMARGVVDAIDVDDGYVRRSGGVIEPLDVLDTLWLLAWVRGLDRRICPRSLITAFCISWVASAVRPAPAGWLVSHA